MKGSQRKRKKIYVIDDESLMRRYIDHVQACIENGLGFGDLFEAFSSGYHLALSDISEERL